MITSESGAPLTFSLIGTSPDRPAGLSSRLCVATGTTSTGKTCTTGGSMARDKPARQLSITPTSLPRLSSALQEPVRLVERQHCSDNQRSPQTGNMVTTRVHPNRNLCSSVPRKVCSTNYQRICRSVPSRACASVPRQQCGLSGDQCRSVPRQRCSSTPERLARQQCRALPQQSCPPVPQQAVDVSCYVGWTISNDLMAKSSPDPGKLDWNLVPG